MNEESKRWLQTLWAKTGEGGATHLLVYHLIDVAEVTSLLWEGAVNANTRAFISRALGLSTDQAGAFLSFLIGLHDLGKASPGFQRKYEAIVPRLKELGLPIGLGVADIPHGIVSAYALAYRGKGLLIEHGLVRNRPTAEALARVVGGHHGIWPDASQLKQAYDASHQPQWEEARQALFDTLYDLYQPPPLPDVDNAMEVSNACLTLISGLTTIADWLGSMVEHFPLQQEWVSLGIYRQAAHERAHTALRETGWEKKGYSLTLPTFNEILPQPSVEPNPVQQAALGALENLKGQSLIILEAPTGIGKTELAFYLSSLALSEDLLQGLYVAMPTQATSNQMHSRVERFLQCLFPEKGLRPRLLHSQAAWQLNAGQTPSGIFGEDGERKVGTASTWFLPKKRGLLEPFAVGTVDQALLSVLWTRHFFVRLFGLAHKVLVFDEVHAYDTYMNELFLTLLAWLRWLGSSVVVLSATLPNKARNQLVEAFGGDTTALVSTDSHHARLTWVDVSGDSFAVSLDDVTEGHDIQLEWVTSGLDAVLSGALNQGGCAAVICNTVGHAQQFYRELRSVLDRGLLDGCEMHLFHARYPPAWRQSIEQDIVYRFGKEGPRPYRGIVIATQVIEQSLDLDFDLLITELPPVDLLIQRIGRLHRHHRDERPSRLKTPRCLLIEPEKHGDLPAFGDSEYVYGKFLLLASWAALQGRDALHLPDQSRELIETVYGEGWRSLPWHEVLSAAYDEMLPEQDSARYQADLKHIPLPGASRLLDGKNVGLDEDDPTLHEAFQAATRLIEPTVQVICLHRVGAGVALEPDGSLPVDLARRAEPHRLLRYVVSIRHRGVFQQLVEGQEYALPKAWADEPALRYHRVAVFTDGLCRIAGTRFVLRLTREFGLEILKEDEL